jgi:beta-N-acetylhexosaminidase
VSDLDACLLARFPGTRPPDWLLRWLESGLGGVLLFAPNITGPDQLRALTATLREHNPDVLIAADEEGGIVTRVQARSGSSYPGNAALGAAGDVSLTRRVAASMGAMLAGAGISLDLAPSADIDANPANPVIGVRSFGADPGLAAAHTAAFVGGMQSAGVAACAKHFPGHGRTHADSHLTLPVADVSLAELNASDLMPFRAAADGGVRAVMTAHVLYPQVDSVPATVSARFLTGILRGECGFDGVVITDALGMAAIGDGEASADGATAALMAGADLLCLPAGHAAQQRARDTLAAAVRDGTIPARRVEDAAARVRELAAWTRCRPAPGTGVPGTAVPGTAVPGTGVPQADGPDAGLPAADPALGAEAARRGLLVATARLPLPAPPYVLDAGGRMSSFLDDTAASLLGVLRARLPATDGVRLTGHSGVPDAPGAAGADPAGLDALIGQAAGRPLVLAVADAHRRPWQAALVRRVLARRPDAVVVGTGTAHDAGLAPGGYLGTRGAGRVNLEAAADMLLGHAPGSAPAGTAPGRC